MARTLDAGGFGAFAIAFLTFGLLIALTRAAIGQPLQITFSSAEPADFARAVRSAMGASLVVGLAAGAGVLVVGTALSGQTGQALMALGVCLPGLLVQDTCRMAFFSSGRADRAALNDGLWTLLEFAALGVLLLAGVRDVGIFILAWGGSATLAAVVALRVLRAAPRLRGSMRWLVGQRGLTGYLIAEHLLGEGLAQIGILMVGVVGSPADVGSLRGAQVLLGPLNIMVTAALLFGIPEIARRQHLERRQRELFCWGLSGAMSVVTLAYATVVLVLPDRFGTMLFGDTWSGAQSVLVPMCVLSLAVALGVGPGVTLYGMGLARTTFGLNLLKAPILLVLLPAGIWWSNAYGAAWAIAATELVLLPFLVVKARRAMRRPLPTPSDEPVVVPSGLSSDLGEDAVLVPETTVDETPERRSDATPP